MKSMKQAFSKGYIPADAYEQAVLDSLTELFSLRHSAIGYKGDKEVYEIFKLENLDIAGQPTFKPLN